MTPTDPTDNPRPRLGVVVVTFNSADVILENLESLLSQAGDVALSIVVVDNGSTDDTIPTLHAWAEGRAPFEAPSDLPFPLSPCPKPVRIAGPGGACPPETEINLSGGGSNPLHITSADPFAPVQVSRISFNQADNIKVSNPEGTTLINGVERSWPPSIRLADKLRNAEVHDNIAYEVARWDLNGAPRGDVGIEGLQLRPDSPWVGTGADLEASRR